MKPKNQVGNKPKMSTRKKWLIAILIVVGCIALSILFGILFMNPAQKKATFLNKEMNRVGGKFVCAQAGRPQGIFSQASAPWYEVSYLVPDSPDYAETINKVMSDNGYPMISTTQYKEEKNTEYYQYGTQLKLPDLSKYLDNDRGSEYFISENTNGTATLDIYRVDSGEAYCGQSKPQGFKVIVPADQALIHFRLSLPPGE